jgi:MerR family transcriptional regulator, light-induced transcriptional regulator
VRYTVKAAARATGISESRLRTWERRYGIPSPNRAPTGRRLYDEDDLAVIRRMAAMTDAGMAASEAAEAARSGVTVAEEARAAEHELVATLAGAAEVFDEAAFVSGLRQAIEDLGWASALGEVIFPALKRVGIYWETAVIPPANEHFAAELVRREILGSLKVMLNGGTDQPLVLMACPEDERHDLGLSALNLLLRSEGLRTVYLGADVPTGDLFSACDAISPDAICLSATSATGMASLVRASRAIVGSRRVRLFFGGPAMSASGTEAAGIKLPESIADATDAIVKVLRAAR